MPALADVQAAVRQALIEGDATRVAPLLVGGGNATGRLAIHQRQYASSLVTALLDRFPATIWLVGSSCVTDAALAFVRTCPPRRPCIAEYGDAFPEYLSVQPGAARLPYLRSFAALEWSVGETAVAIDAPPVPPDTVRALGARLADATLTLQPGVRYLGAAWAIDDLFTVYLTAAAPAQFVLAPDDIWLEVRGARGEFRLTRLEQGAFVFRTALAAGRSVAAAVEEARRVDDRFEAGRALAALLHEGLLTTVTPQQPGDVA